MHSMLKSITFIKVFWLTRKELAAANNTGKMRVDGFSSASTPRNQTTANIGRSMAAMRKDLRSVSSLVLLFSRRRSLWLPSHRERSLRPSTDNVVFALKNNHTHFEYFILNFRHCVSCIQDRRFTAIHRTLFMYLINKYISFSDICLTVHH